MNNKNYYEIMSSVFWVFLSCLFVSSEGSNFMMLIIYNLALGVIPIYLWISNNRSLEVLGLFRLHLSKQLIAGVILLLIVITPIKVILLIFDIKYNQLLAGSINDIREVIVRFFIMVSVGFGEEVFFRGYLLSLFFSATSSKIFTILATSVIFGLSHLIVNKSIIQMIFTTIFGILLASGRMYFKNCTLVSLIITHSFYNCILIIIMFFM